MRERKELLRAIGEEDLSKLTGNTCILSMGKTLILTSFYQIRSLCNSSSSQSNNILGENRCEYGCRSDSLENGERELDLASEGGSNSDESTEDEYLAEVEDSAGN